jgi:hypothetical protein
VVDWHIRVKALQNLDSAFSELFGVLLWVLNLGIRTPSFFLFVVVVCPVVLPLE